MGNVGRFVCVAMPFALTVGSLIAILVAGLAGVADKSLYLFQVNPANLSISPLSLGSLVNSRSPAPFDFHDAKLLGDGSSSGSGSGSAASGANIKAADLGLYNLYDIGLWGYCYTKADGSRECTKPEFNWAENAFNKSTSSVESLATATGQKVDLPKEIKDAMTAFSSITRWTEIVFIVAVVALGLEVFFGIFSTCSRIFSCLTYIIAGLAATAVCVAAGLATAMAVVVVGTIEGSAKIYGVQASFNGRFLAAIWISAALAIAAALFWLFTVCCCKPEHRQKRSKKHHDEAGEKLIPTGAYKPIHDDGHGGFYNNSNNNATSYGAPRYPSGGRSDLAYEPYSSRH